MSDSHDWDVYRAIRVFRSKPLLFIDELLLYHRQRPLPTWYHWRTHIPQRARRSAWHSHYADHARTSFGSAGVAEWSPKLIWRCDQIKCTVTYAWSVINQDIQRIRYIIKTHFYSLLGTNFFISSLLSYFISVLTIIGNRLVIIWVLSTKRTSVTLFSLIIRVVDLRCFLRFHAVPGNVLNYMIISPIAICAILLTTMPDVRTTHSLLVHPHSGRHSKTFIRWPSGEQAAGVPTYRRFYLECGSYFSATVNQGLHQTCHSIPIRWSHRHIGLLSVYR